MVVTQYSIVEAYLSARRTYHEGIDEALAT